MAEQELSPELRLALSHGAEIGLARTIALDPEPGAVANFIKARLSGLSSLDVSYIHDLAQEIVAAGSYITSLEPDEDINPNLIPTVPVVNDDEWSGRRTRTPAQWSPDDGETWFNFTLNLPDITSFGDLIAYANELAQSYIDAYPGKFEEIVGQDITSVTVRVVGQEKAF